MLHIENLSLQFNDTPLLCGFSLHLPSGESLCLRGPSGCGKSSLLRAVMGFVPVAGGSVRVGQVQLSPRTAEALRRSVAYLPQELALPDEWVSQMVQTPFRLRANAKSRFSRERLMQHFELLGLESQLYDRRVNEISGGQRQRIMLAVSALLDKPLMLLDEPTSALDAESVALVQRYLACQCHRQGRAVLAVSHDAQFAGGCDRVVELPPAAGAEKGGGDGDD